MALSLTGNQRRRPNGSAKKSRSSRASLGSSLNTSMSLNNSFVMSSYAHRKKVLTLNPVTNPWNHVYHIPVDCGRPSLPQFEEQYLWTNNTRIRLFDEKRKAICAGLQWQIYVHPNWSANQKYFGLSVIPIRNHEEETIPDHLKLKYTVTTRVLSHRQAYQPRNNTDKSLPKQLQSFSWNRELDVIPADIAPADGSADYTDHRGISTYRSNYAGSANGNENKELVSARELATFIETLPFSIDDLHSLECVEESDEYVPQFRLDVTILVEFVQKPQVPSRYFGVLGAVLNDTEKKLRGVQDEFDRTQASQQETESRVTQEMSKYKEEIKTMEEQIDKFRLEKTDIIIQHQRELSDLSGKHHLEILELTKVLNKEQVRVDEKERDKSELQKKIDRLIDENQSLLKQQGAFKQEIVKLQSELKSKTQSKEDEILQNLSQNITTLQQPTAIQSQASPFSVGMLRSQVYASPMVQQSQQRFHVPSSTGISHHPTNASFDAGLTSPNVIKNLTEDMQDTSFVSAMPVLEPIPSGNDNADEFKMNASQQQPSSQQPTRQQQPTVEPPQQQQSQPQQTSQPKQTHCYESNRSKPVRVMTKEASSDVFQDRMVGVIQISNESIKRLFGRDTQTENQVLALHQYMNGTGAVMRSDCVVEWQGSDYSVRNSGWDGIFCAKFTTSEDAKEFCDAYNTAIGDVPTQSNDVSTVVPVQAAVQSPQTTSFIASQKTSPQKSPQKAATVDQDESKQESTTDWNFGNMEAHQPPQQQQQEQSQPSDEPAQDSVWGAQETTEWGGNFGFNMDPETAADASGAAAPAEQPSWGFSLSDNNKSQQDQADSSQFGGVASSSPIKQGDASTGQAEAEDEDQEDNCMETTFKPLVELDEVEVKEHPDGEEFLGEHGFKRLYRWGKDVAGTACWKQRCSDSTVRFYRSIGNGRVRMVCWEHQTNKLRMNQYVPTSANIVEKTSSILIWDAIDDTIAQEDDETEGFAKFCIRFADTDSAKRWKQAFNDGEKINNGEVISISAPAQAEPQIQAQEEQKQEAEPEPEQEEQVEVEKTAEAVGAGGDTDSDGDDASTDAADDTDSDDEEDDEENDTPIEKTAEELAMEEFARQKRAEKHVQDKQTASLFASDDKAEQADFSFGFAADNDDNDNDGGSGGDLGDLFSGAAIGKGVDLEMEKMNAQFGGAAEEETAAINWGAPAQTEESSEQQDDKNDNPGSDAFATGFGNITMQRGSEEEEDGAAAPGDGLGLSGFSFEAATSPADDNNTSSVPPQNDGSEEVGGFGNFGGGVGFEAFAAGDGEAQWGAETADANGGFGSFGDLNANNDAGSGGGWLLQQNDSVSKENTAANGDQRPEGGDGDDNCVEFNIAPIVELQEQHVQSGHENETLLEAFAFKKLYRWGEDVTQQKCWKVRSTDSKLSFYQNKDNGKVRLVSRENITNKLRLNHLIPNESQFSQRAPTQFQWCAVDITIMEEDAAEEDTPTMFLIRFAEEDIALKFKALFENVAENNASV